LGKFARAAHEFAVYIASNAGSLINYGERFRLGERISSCLAESTVNAVISKRFAKRQQMQWTKRGAHLLLQTRRGPSTARFERCSSAGIRGWPTTTETKLLKSPRREYPRLSDGLTSGQAGVSQLITERLTTGRKSTLTSGGSEVPRRPTCTDPACHC